MNKTEPHPLLERPSVSTLAARYIRERIQNGTWVKHLPGEHDLCHQLQISRHSLRAALETLRDEGLLKIQKSFRTRIITKKRSAAEQKTNTIHLLTPTGVEEFGPFMSGWFFELRKTLWLNGFSLQIDPLPRLFRSHSPKRLRDYVNDCPGDLWILQVATSKMQHWFMEQQIPAILAGTPHPGVDLPFVDVHSRAAARHAAGQLFAAGHKHVAMISSAHHYAGDHAAIEGVHEAVAAHKESGSLCVNLIEFSAEPDGVYRKLTPVLENSPSPTGLIICQQVVVCAVYSVLNRLKKRVPEDVSIVCLQSGDYMEYITPRICRYESDPKLFAAKLSQLVRHRLERKRPSPEFAWVIPKYIEGKTIASCRSGDTGPA